MTVFSEARAEVKRAEAALQSLDRLLALMDTFAARLAAEGKRPEVRFDPETCRLTLEVAAECDAGPILVPLSIRVAGSRPVEDAGDGAASPPLAKPSLGDLSDAAQGLGSLEPRPAVVPFAIQLPPAFAPEPAAGEFPSETEGAITAEHPGAPCPDGGSRGSRPPSGRTDGRSGSAEAAEEGETDAPAAGGSPAPGRPTPAGLSIEARAVWARLEEVADPEWPDARDLALAEMLGGGYGAEDAAVRLDVQKADVVARWRRICPMPTIHAQELLVRMLRLRAGVAACRA